VLTGADLQVLGDHSSTAHTDIQQLVAVPDCLVTSLSVVARPGVAGMRWYELRRPGDQPVVWQQATYSPDDGVNRWMGSIAQDRRGSMALGYSVSNGTNVFPGIRYTGRLRGDPANTMGQGEAVIVNGARSVATMV
jgi:hypothetical protein